MTKIIRCENCNETHEVENMEDADIEGCESENDGMWASEGLHKFNVVAEVTEDEEDDSDNNEDDDWRTMSSDECKKRNGLGQVNGVLWERGA